MTNVIYSEYLKQENIMHSKTDFDELEIALAAVDARVFWEDWRAMKTYLPYIICVFAMTAQFFRNLFLKTAWYGNC